MSDGALRRVFSLRSLVSPAMLFALGALFVGLPGLLHAAAPPAPPRIELQLLPVHPPSGSHFMSQAFGHVRTSTVHPFTLGGPLATLFFASLPTFALMYALWPRAFRRSLRADLGRWHAAFAIVPTLLAPALVLLVFVLLSPFAPRSAPSTTFITSVRCAVGVLWLTGLAIFGVNALFTLRRRDEDHG